MAAIEERSGRYRIHFRWHSRQQKLPLGKVSAEEAASKAAQADYLLMRFKQRLIELPSGVDIGFVQFDGKPPADLQDISTESRELALASFRDCYLATHSESLEDPTIEGIGLHFKHLIAALGERFPIRELKLADLQGYVVDRRTKAKGIGGQARALFTQLSCVGPKLPNGVAPSKSPDRWAWFDKRVFHDAGARNPNPTSMERSTPRP